jgi:hypothetical protein
MERNNLGRSHEDAFLTSYEETIVRYSVKGLAKMLARDIALNSRYEGTDSQGDSIAKCPYIEGHFCIFVGKILNFAINEGMLTAVTSLRRIGYPKIKLDDGTIVPEDEISELERQIDSSY